MKLAGMLLPEPRLRDLTIDVVKLRRDNRGIPIRLLRPQVLVSPLYLHFHGEAWVLGNSQLDDGWNAEIARSSDVVIATGDLRLAVDDDLERTIRDAVALTEWALDRLPEFGTDLLVVPEAPHGSSGCPRGLR